MAFRKLWLPADIAGRVYLHSMPGRYRPFPEDEREALSRGISAVARLCSDHETGDKSPEYREAIAKGLLKWQDLHFPMPDYGIPQSLEDCRSFVEGLIARLRSGERILIHCAAGVGRTGTMAAALLVALGVDLEQALRRVAVAGAQAESESQVTFLKALAEDQ